MITRTNGPRGRRLALVLVTVLLPGTAPVPPEALAAEPPPVPRVQAVPLPGHVTSFRLDDRELVAFHHDPRSPRPFWYPLRGSHEPSLTRMGHPHDSAGHSHHNSVWISHHDLNGVDFWGDRARRQGRITTVEIPREAFTEGDEAAALRSVHHWLDADGTVVAVERRRSEVRSLGGPGDWLLVVDLELAPAAEEPLTFGGTAFGLVGVRMARSIGVHDGGGRILNSAGQRNEAAAFRRPARWCDYAGRITNAPGGLGGVALLDHPGNHGHPAPFHVRDDGWMGACLSLEEPLVVPADEPLRLRYGLWVHDGIPEGSVIEDRWRAFAALPADIEGFRPFPDAGVPGTGRP